MKKPRGLSVEEIEEFRRIGESKAGQVKYVGSYGGLRTDTKTGIPPVFSAEARERWQRDRSPLEIERLFE